MKAQPAGIRPDVICLGLQETSPYEGGGFLGQKLASWPLLGKMAGGGVQHAEVPVRTGQQPLTDMYELLGTAQVDGFTKPGQFFSNKPCSQVIQILARQSARAFITNVNFIAEQQAVKGIRKKIGFTSEKGYVIADLTFHGNRVAFVSTHLNSNSDEKRQTECEVIRQHLASLAMTGGGFSAVFVMGDLNYRISRAGGTSGSDQTYLINQLATRSGRATAYGCDTFSPNGGVSVLRCEWPRHNEDCFPTYKRTRKNAMAIKAFAAAFDTATGRVKSPEGTMAHNLIQSVYFADGKLSYKKERGDVWDFGWLDRIGYALPKQGAPNPMVSGNLKFRGGSPAPEIFDFKGAVGGDHAPVYCNFIIEGF